MQAGEASAPAADAQTSPAMYGERGAGGKLRRERKPPSTPYDRPSQLDSHRGGWISRIVDPAKRLITGGATLLLPSIFSPLDSSNRDEVQTEVETRNNNESPSMDLGMQLVVSKSTKDVGPNEAKGKMKLYLSDKDAQEKIGDRSDGVVPDVEQLIKEKTFSREEIDRLMEILRSRAVDAEEEKKIPSTSAAKEVGKAETSHGKQKTWTEKTEELDKFELATSTPLARPTIQDGIGASPVDIARAYMVSRTSEVDFASTGLASEREKFAVTSEFSSKSFLPSPLPKAPLCWPGAITQDQLGCSTPQNQKSKYGLHSFPRTPYSRTIHSKSKSKINPLRGDSEMFSNISSTPFQPTRTPAYGKSLTNVAESSYGSGGPIRRMHKKFTSATPTRESGFLRTAQRSPFTKASDEDIVLKKNFELVSSSATNFESVNRKGKSSELGVSSVHPHSSKLARQILEQLDRPITLKEKSEELKLAASWKNSSEAAMATPIENNSSHIFGAGFSKRLNVDAIKHPSQTNAESSFLPQCKTNAVNGAGEGVTSSSMISLDKRSATLGNNIGPSASIQKLNSQIKSSDQGLNNNLPKGNDHPRLFGNHSKGPVDANNSAAGPEPPNVQRRPILPSISINKPGLRASFGSDTSAGFTFPVTTSSNTSAEPPTPSIMPSSSVSPPQQAKASVNLPTFTFGNKITIAPPVVPFTSTSTVSTPNDTLAPKFKFGSGKTRLSFALVGDDASTTPNDVAAAPKYKFGSGKSRLNFGSVGSDAVSC